MTDTKIEPALTAEEWHDWEVGLLPLARRKIGIAGNVRISMNTNPIESPEETRAMAALCLAGQPFGFTRADVKLLRFATNFILPKAEKLRDLADRIEALLPGEPSV